MSNLFKMKSITLTERNLGELIEKISKTIENNHGYSDSRDETGSYVLDYADHSVHFNPNTTNFCGIVNFKSIHISAFKEKYGKNS